MRSQATARHYTPHATLAAVGIKINRLQLFDTIGKYLYIKQKTVKHKPVEKLKDAFIAILAGAHGLCEINTRLRGDEPLQRAFGRAACADQSVVQQTLNACTEVNVLEMQQAMNVIFRRHARAYSHNYRAQWQLLDIDLTGLPCSKNAELSAKGYFSKEGIRYGRQLGRVVATDYEEIVVDRLYAGNTQLYQALRQLVALAEETLDLNDYRRSRTVLRIDAGGGRLDDINWLLSRGYQLHGKDISAQRAAGWAATVKRWYDDPLHPGRQVGWAVPESTPDYLRPVRRLVIRWHKRNGHVSHAMLISTLEPEDVLGLLGQPPYRRGIINTTARHFSPRASLAALGLRLRRLGLFEAITSAVKVPQKTVRHTPAEKLYGAFLAILAGAHGLSEINTRLRSDPALQRSFGRRTCAEYSLVQDTLDACTPHNVDQLRRVVTALFRQHSRAARHDYSAALHLLDIDMTGLPCGPKAELSLKGYFSKGGIRCGRQLGHVVAGATQEVVADLLFAGNVQLNSALRSLVAAAEDVLCLDRWRRRRTVPRMDSGGSSLGDLNWCLARGYQLHCKDISGQRAEVWASTVVEWFDDPAHPERQVGRVVPEQTPDYVRPVRRLAIRWRKRNRQLGHDLLISTLAPGEVLKLLGRPRREASEPELMALAYARLYDRRAGAIEVEIREDKQGVGITRRRKKRAAAQAMLALLGTLAHNVLVWAREWLGASEPRLKRYGIVRLVRDVLCVRGFVEADERGAVTGIVLNRGSTLARLLAGGLREVLGEQPVTVALGSLSD